MRILGRIVGVRSTEQFVWHLLTPISYDRNAIFHFKNAGGYIRWELNPATDIILLLTTCRGGNHLTSEYTFVSYGSSVIIPSLYDVVYKSIIRVFNVISCFSLL